jgi:hypothetical protein
MRDRHSRLRTVAYVSRATCALDYADLHQLSLKASLHNGRVDVTGLLLFADSVFVETLEGFSGDIEVIFKHIQNDPRHVITTVFVNESITRRIYPAWSMMASLFPMDPTLVSFLRSRQESSDRRFTHNQLVAVNRTLEFVCQNNISAITQPGEAVSVR